MSGAKCSTSSPSASFPATRSRRSPRRARPGPRSSSATPGGCSRCKNIEHFDFAGWDIALFAIGLGRGQGSTRRSAAAAGCMVIDNSSLYRMDPDVPLIVPEVNPDAIDGYKRKNIIANPNCSTAQMVVALKPLHDAAQDQARGGLDLPVGLRRGQGGDGRAVRAEPQHLRRRRGRAARSSPSRSPST